MKNIFKKIAVLIPLVLATTFASAAPCGIFGGEPEIVQAKAAPLQAYECGPKSYINDTERKVLIVTDKSDWDFVKEEEFELVSQWLGLKSQMLTPSIVIIDYSKVNADHLRAMKQHHQPAARHCKLLIILVFLPTQDRFLLRGCLR